MKGSRLVAWRKDNFKKWLRAPASGRSRIRSLALAATLVGGAAAQPNPSVQSSDGLRLAFAADGRMSALQIDANAVPLVREPVLFHLRDAVAKTAFAPVPIATRQEGASVVCNSRSELLGLTLTARLASRGDYLEVKGEVAVSGETERCVDLKLCVPMNGRGFTLGTGLFVPGDQRLEGAAGKKSSRRAVAADADLDASETSDDAIYPLCPISNPAAGTGLTLAVPPTHPTRFNVGLDSTGAHIVFRIGLSPHSARPGRTAFHAIIYRHDATWGFRSALARYYDFYRAEFFTRRVHRIGAWTTQNASQLAHPELYAYHEAGFSTWRTPGGTESGINLKPSLERLDEGPVATSLSDYERLCELAADEKLGIYSLPYTIVGQRQLLQLPELPKDFAAAMRTLDEWSPRGSILFDGPPQAGSFRSADEQRATIRNSTLHDERGSLAVLPRPYRGPTLTFPQNPSPQLFRDSGRPTVASYTLDYYIPMMLRSPLVDGIYLDSLGRWCGFYNYRAEHFKDATVPLTYHGGPARVCLWNLQSHAEYMWEASRRLHAQGKILMANGLSPERVMLGFACDVMGREGVPALESGEGFYAMRVMAGAKPYCVLNATHRVSARLWNSCLFEGYLMGCNTPGGLADEAKYLPWIIKCNEAGWQPITHARAAPRVVGVERWGGGNAGSSLYFTVMNRSREAVAAELTVDVAALGLAARSRAVDCLSGADLVTSASAAQVVVKLELAPEQATVFELRD